MKQPSLCAQVLTLTAFIILASACGARKPKPETLEPDASVALCSSTREYVTSLEFLRSQKQFAMGDDEAQKAARRVADGCTGAGRRFVHTTELLVKAGLGSRDAVSIGIESALKTDSDAQGFAAVFVKSFLHESLDLDLPSSIRMARSLSLDLHGNVEKVREDFERLADFCINAKTLDLPRPTCGIFAGRVAQKGNDFGGGISKPFIATFEFLKSEKGPALATGDAMNVAEEVISSGPLAEENFIQAFKYATSRSGLDLSRKDAITFAKDMAKKTFANNDVKSSAKAAKPEKALNKN